MVNLLGEHETVHVWHLHVQNSHVQRDTSLHLGKRLLAGSIRVRKHAPGLRLQGEDGAVCRVIVHDQNTLPSKLRLARIQIRAPLSRSSLRLDGEMKGRAHTRLAFDPHAAAHLFGQAFADSQTQSGAAVAPGRRSIDLAEGVE